MQEIIEHNFELRYFILGWFITLFLYYSVNVSYVYKKMLKKSIASRHKVLDCLPCFTFWTVLISTQSILLAMASWVIVILYENFNKQ